ncbi:ribonuclease R [Desulfovibrio intestinalis]|uniref:Ribonuclease R n=1 Tax=Desulfovibrio intestinalis TaxID=58621 RepID=A0A7W8FE17_9BACT|nr:ribonuclease R [Desulfovibrio intestinalis]MBB5143269.1 ribonuclease R [Desulfovibrio intestinalis]
MKKQKKLRGSTSAAASTNGFPSHNELLQTLAAQNRPMRLDGLLRVMGLARRDRKQLEATLEDLEQQGRTLRLRGGLWTRPESLKSITGRFSALREGAGFVTPMRLASDEDPGDSRWQFSGDKDIYIPAALSGGAWHKDMVRVALAPGAQRGPSPEGRVIEVLERGLKEVPAHVISRHGNSIFCRPADSRLPADFNVELPEGTPAPAQGTLVLLAPIKSLASDLWSARLLGDYGREDDVAVQEELVKLNHEVPRDFPAGVLAEAEALPGEPEEADFKGRQDVRHLALVTIDGADARDFDDAIHVEEQPGGKGWVLRVAIADVSHYVRPRGRGCPGALDAEALSRGNSWYFPRSVEPMLPEVLSNGLCSLRPHVNRLAVLAEIPFTATGKPGKPRFSQAVMRSAARLTYDQVKACLLDKDAAALADLRAQERGEEVLAMLDKAFALYAVLRDVRRQRGTLDFDLPEAECKLDDLGRVAWLGHRQRHDAHRLIEEFMIAANEAVARHLRDAEIPFLYRVHPEPDPERLETLFDTLEAVGFENLPPRPTAASMQGVLVSVQGTPQEFLVNRLCLRAMPQARYMPFNEGHFGLASVAYCHFTSPIRRYADLLTHRALKMSLGLDAGPLPAGEKLLRIGDQLNRRERAAMACEREMDRRLGCLALLPRVGEHFSGIVAGVMDFGVFVELTDMPVEGMVRVEDLGDDWYDFDARTMSLVGQHSGIIWRMGQKLDVALAEVNLGRLEIRLMPLELPKGIGSRGPRGARGKGSPTSRAAAGRKGSSSGWKLVSPGDGESRGKNGKSGKPARNGKKNGADKSAQPGRPSARKGKNGQGGKNTTGAPGKSGRPGKKSAGKRG